MNIFTNILRPDGWQYPRYGDLQFDVGEDDGKLYTRDEFEFQRQPGKKEKVPAGFKSDLASIPIIIRAIFPPWGRYTKAALVHDWDYKTGGRPKLAADLWFMYGMRRYGVPLWKAIPFTLATMTVGWIAWYRHRIRDWMS